MQELAVSLEHQSLKDERENITQNFLSKNQPPFFFLMNNSLHTPCSQKLEEYFRKVTTFSIDLKIDYVEVLIKIRDLY